MRALRSLAVLLALTAVLLVGGAAALAGDGAITSTDVEHGVFVNPGEALSCLGDAPYVVAIDYVAVDHRTATPSGGFLSSGTLTGAMEATPRDDPALPSYAGQITMNGVWHLTPGNATSTFNTLINALGSDGSRLAVHGSGHITAGAAGTAVQFERVSC
jgi:hypothetical protein